MLLVEYKNEMQKETHSKMCFSSSFQYDLIRTFLTCTRLSEGDVCPRPQNTTIKRTKTSKDANYS